MNAAMPSASRMGMAHNQRSCVGSRSSTSKLGGGKLSGGSSRATHVEALLGAASLTAVDGGGGGATGAAIFTVVTGGWICSGSADSGSGGAADMEGGSARSGSLSQQW